MKATKASDDFDALRLKGNLSIMANSDQSEKRPKVEPSKPNRRSILKAAVGAAAAGMVSRSGKAKADDGPVRNLVQFGKRASTKLSPLKQRAMNDYRQSLAQYGGQLSSPIRELFLTAKNENQIHFGVVVVGSGYGASITAVVKSGSPGLSPMPSKMSWPTRATCWPDQPRGNKFSRLACSTFR